jgi:hypothetical protein
MNRPAMIVKQLHADVVHHLLRHQHHLHRLHVAEHKDEDEHRDVQADDPPEVLRRAVRDVAVDRLLDQQRLRELEGRGRQQQQDRQYHAHHVRPHVRHQPADEDGVVRLADGAVFLVVAVDRHR